MPEFEIPRPKRTWLPDTQGLYIEGKRQGPDAVTSTWFPTLASREGISFEELLDERVGMEIDSWGNHPIVEALEAHPEQAKRFMEIVSMNVIRLVKEAQDRAAVEPLAYPPTRDSKPE